METGTSAGAIHPSVGRAHLRLVSGSGCHVRDDQGITYLDAVAGVGVMSLGYGRDDIVAAATTQARKLPFSHSMRFANEASDALAARLRGLTPDGIDWFFFCSGGSEALDSAVKIIRHYWLDRGQPSRWRIIARRPSFHGNTLAGLSVGYHAARRTPFLPYLSDMPHIPAPWRLHCTNHGDGVPACGACTGTALEEAIQEAGPDSVAAFIAEPIVGAAAPAVTPDPGYYETIRAICDRYDVLFVSDEVMTGVGRTGRDFAIQHWAASPDLMLIAKGIGGGYAPLAAVGVHGRLIETIRAGGGRIEHNFTMAGNPLACAVGDAVLEAYVREGIADNAGAMGDRLLGGLATMRRHAIVGEVRGRGLMAGIELTRPGTSQPLPAELGAARRLEAHARANGLLVYPCSGIVDGVTGDAILLLPPLVIDEPTIDELLAKLDTALAATDAELLPQL